ncbi:hypothetical protein UFOVP460_47 [uncultured Caudovirales phage]|uniref:Uncharacterized protein n=1 Tax=uncultured Caudovirales phage TaxID=2100421 RepID=A0A6J5MLW9_9CAUD|nr:hypothetical protein UFOVP460_47 [uncultured Caudovirales phage]
MNTETKAKETQEAKEYHRRQEAEQAVKGFRGVALEDRLTALLDLYSKPL